MENYYYNKIAHDYHLKRSKPWNSLNHFLNQLYKKGYRFKGITIDLGCANGRNFEIFKPQPNNKLIGIDNSLEFLYIARKNVIKSNNFSKIEQNNIQLILADLKALPIRNNSIQNIFSVATIHHIEKKAERDRVINQIFNSLKKNGYFLSTVWRRWQKKYKTFFIRDWFYRKFNKNYAELQKKSALNEFGDKLIPWTVSAENKVYNRFYHFFSKREVKRLLKIFNIKEIRTMGGPTNKDNFFILTQKI